jgi:hypothetical protein
MAENTKVKWRKVHPLAAELALNRVSKNLVQDVVTYLRAYPETPLLAYAKRLKQLSAEGYFQAGKSGPYERLDLYDALKRVKIPDDADPALQLAWVARLIEYYTQHLHIAARASGLGLRKRRRGEQLSGTVREAFKSTAWVQVTSGQWGRARRRFNVEAGDEVTVQVTQARSRVDFDVDIVRVTKRRPPQTLPEVCQPTPASEEPFIEVSEERDEEISQAADDFMAFLQQKWESAEE